MDNKIWEIGEIPHRDSEYYREREIIEKLYKDPIEDEEEN